MKVIVNVQRDLWFLIGCLLAGGWVAGVAPILSHPS